MTRVDRQSPMPLYFQLKRLLLEKVTTHAWKPGDLVPSEQELQVGHQLSRTTVRQALTELVAEGYLVRQRGRGTFVAQPKFEHSPLRRRGISQYLIAQGLTPGLRVLDADWAHPTPAVRAALQLEAGQRAYRIRRLRLADDQPIGVLTSWLPETVARAIDTAALNQGESLHYLRNLPQMLKTRATRAIEAVPAREEEARLLLSRKGSPMLMIERTVIGADGAPVEFMRAVYRGDRLKYQVPDD